MEIEPELMALILWIIGSLIVGMVARHRGKSWLGYIFLSLILSPLLGIAFVLLSKPADTPETPDAPKVSEDQAVDGSGNIHTADTNILTPEEAAALRVRAEEEEHKTSSSPNDRELFNNAHTFKPGEIAAVKQDEDDKN